MVETWKTVPFPFIPWKPVPETGLVSNRYNS
jgi:hypothetical protein